MGERMALTARDVMRTEVETVGPELTLPELERAFMKKRVSGFPVIEGEGRLVGIISRSDVVRHLTVERSRAEVLSDYYRDGGMGDVPSESLESIGQQVGARVEHVPVKEVMLRAVVTVTPDELLRDVARKLIEHQVHRVPVVDGTRLVGIVSSLDLVRVLAEEQG